MPIWPFHRKATRSNAIASSTQPSDHVLSLLSPEEVQSFGGLPVEGIAGRFVDDSMSVEAFRQNPAFVDFMHEVIRTTGPNDPELREAAQEQRDGWVYIIDLRTPEGPGGRVPPEDIIGAFEVQDGQIVADSYQASSTHRVYTNDGMVCLPPSLRRALVKRLPKVS